jgi:hypothetical protein
MNKFTLTIIAAMFSVNAFAAVAHQETFTKTLPCGKQVKCSKYDCGTKHSRQTATVVASNNDKAADSNGRAKK